MRTPRLTLALLLAWPGAAWAQATEPSAPEPAPASGVEVDEATKSSARLMANDGSALYRDGKFNEAYDKFNRAYELLRLPILGLWSARCLEGAGRWIEAGERYHQVAHLPLAADAPDAQREATQQAHGARVALQQRIPALIVRIEGAEAKDVELTVDGVALSAAFVGDRRLVDPGAHVVEGKRGDDVRRQAVNVAEQQTQTVMLQFPKLDTPIVLAPQGLAPEEPGSGETPPRRTGNDATVAWLTIGVGGALLAAGGVYGALAAGESADLADKCPNERCGPAQHDAVDSLESLKLISTIGVLGGAAVTGLGVFLLMGVEDDPSVTGVSAYVGLGSAGVNGRF